MMNDAPVILPPGNYAIVEVLGHRTYVGRIDEVERFGTKMMSIEPVFSGALLPALFVGGASIYQMTPCTPEIATTRMATEEWQLPLSVRATIPPSLLPAPTMDEEDLPQFLREGSAVA